MNSYFEQTILEKYNSFLEQVNKLLDNNLLNEYKKENNEHKLKRCYNLYHTLKDDKIFNLFLRCKIKLFSSKEKNTNLVSESMFGNILTLKKIFNNRTQDIKAILWKYLHLIYLLMESSQEDSNENRISLIHAKLEQIKKPQDNISTTNTSTKTPTDPNNLKNKVKKKLFTTELNNTTNNMIDDIVTSFQDSLQSNSSNPFESIMDISKKISEKYEDDINSGKVEMDKLLGDMQNMIPGGDLLKSLGKKPKKEKIVMDENFSTAQVELGQKDDGKSRFNIGNMLKVANNLVGGKGNSKEMCDMMGIVGEIGKIKTEEEANKLKDNLNKYVSSLGIDMNEFNKQVKMAESMLENVKDNLQDCEKELEEVLKVTDIIEDCT